MPDAPTPNTQPEAVPPGSSDVLAQQRDQRHAAIEAGAKRFQKGKPHQLKQKVAPSTSPAAINPQVRDFQAEKILREVGAAKAQMTEAAQLLPRMKALEDKLDAALRRLSEVEKRPRR